MAPFGARAREHTGGIIDLSQGTPVDATPAFIQQALKESANSPVTPRIFVAQLRIALRSSGVPIDAATWPKSDIAWINSPSNPTGRVHSKSELEAVIAYARTNNSLVVSDECYLNFPDSGPSPISILKLADGNNKNLLAVHSMSKRSNCYWVAWGICRVF